MSGRMDRFTATLTRGLARRTSRRSFLGALGASLVGGAAGPLLPIARAEGPAREPLPGEPLPDSAEGNPDGCSYWRYCAIDGAAAEAARMRARPALPCLRSPGWAPAATRWTARTM